MINVDLVGSAAAVQPTNRRRTLASSMVSRMAFGFPGRLSISALPRSPAVCLDSTAVGTTLPHTRQW